jgi:hypothetical protein
MEAARRCKGAIHVVHRELCPSIYLIRHILKILLGSFQKCVQQRHTCNFSGFSLLGHAYASPLFLFYTKCKQDMVVAKGENPIFLRPVATSNVSEQITVNYL